MLNTNDQSFQLINERDGEGVQLFLKDLAAKARGMCLKFIQGFQINIFWTICDYRIFAFPF
jgi:hypothetical protein